MLKSEVELSLGPVVWPSAETHLASKAETIASVQVELDNWFARNVYKLKTVIRLVFGLVWAIDASFKFQSGFAQHFSDLISSAGQNQPSWLNGWFSFWANMTSSDPSLWAYSAGTLEFILAICLILGFFRKPIYTFGFFYSLVLWSVPEGFGGPYGPSSTDIGTGIIYAIVFLFLLLINATMGPSKYSVDHLIEQRWPSWKRVAEIRHNF